MSEHIKKYYCLLLVFLFCSAALTVDAAEAADLCGEDERVLLSVTGHDYFSYYVYDEQGNRLGRLPAAGWGSYARLVHRDALFPSDTTVVPCYFTNILNT